MYIISVIIFDGAKKKIIRRRRIWRRVPLVHSLLRTAAAVVWLPSILEERGISQKTLVARAGYAREGYSLTLAYSRWRRKKKKSPYKQLRRTRSLVASLIRLDYASSGTADVIIIILSITIIFFLPFFAFRIVKCFN